MREAALIDKPDRRYVPWYRRCIPSWRTVAVAVLILLATPFAIRWYRLWRMPDVPLPFDVEAFSELPLSEDNAFTHFQKAVFQHRGFNFQPGVYERLFDSSVPVAWSDVPEDVQTWVMNEQPALSLFRRAGRCPTAAFIPADRYTYTTLLPMQQTLRDFFRLTYLDVLRLLDEGNTREAAEVLHDSFRASRHLGRRGCMIERLIGAACHNLLVPRWQEWSRHPHVAAEDLEAALDRLREDWQLTPPPSDNLKVECLMIIDGTRPPMTYLRDEFNDAIDKLSKKYRGTSAKSTISRINATIPNWQFPILWVIGEPELTSRAARLWLTHELKTCDLPSAEQPSRVAGHFQLCDPPDLTAELTATRLNQRLEMSLLKLVEPATGQCFEAIRREAGRQTLLEIELLLQIRYRRNHVASQEGVEPWLADFPWPVDPCSPAGALIQYRATEEGLKIWSVGSDGLDQGGQHDNSPIPPDIVVTIPWPTRKP